MRRRNLEKKETKTNEEKIKTNEDRKGKRRNRNESLLSARKLIRATLIASILIVYFLASQSATFNNQLYCCCCCCHHYRYSVILSIFRVFSFLLLLFGFHVRSFFRFSNQLIANQWHYYRQIK